VGRIHHKIAHRKSQFLGLGLGISSCFRHAALHLPNKRNAVRVCA
jgi:hypothetical protein